MATREAILEFVKRIARDSEFREWYATSPSEALASYGLDRHELRFLARSLEWDDSQRFQAEALRPFVELLIDTASTNGAGSSLRYARLTAEVSQMRDRIALAQARQDAARPWWKFW